LETRRTLAAAAITVLAATLGGCASSSHAPESQAVVLFDGRSLDGWVKRGGHADYAVEDGQIVGTTRPNQPNTFLCTTREFADFELALEFKVHPELNSGIQIRSLSLPEYQNGRVHGYQVEIDPSARSWTGGLYDEGRRGWLASLEKKPEAQAAFKQGEWNAMRIRAEGDRFRVWINGIPTCDHRDSLTPRGFIALQVHGVGPRPDPLTIRWRNIRLLRLDPAGSN
jgi:hypothetical protein